MTDYSPEQIPVAAKSELYVVLRVGSEMYAVPAANVTQLDVLGPVTRVPGTPSYVRGLVQIRQQVVPLIDLRARFGLQPMASPDARVIVMQIKERRVALLADEAREVCELKADQFQAPPALLHDPSNTSGLSPDVFIRGLYRDKNRFLLLLDCESIVGERQGHG